MTDQEINDACRKLDERTLSNDAYCPDGLRETGKCVPYIGWFWRTVDFDRPLVIAQGMSFVGFCENNKWDYKEDVVSEGAKQKIRHLLVEALQADTKEKYTVLYDYMQTLMGPYTPSERDIACSLRHLGLAVEVYLRRAEQNDTESLEYLKEAFQQCKGVLDAIST